MTSTASSTRQAPRDGSTTPWLAIASLGLGNFALVTSEFLPASLLTPMARDLGITEGVAGQAVTATAIMGAIVGPTLSSLIPRLDRRYLMLLLTGMMVASNATVAVAHDFSLLLAARLLLGAAIAGFWAMAIAIVGQLASPKRMGRAMTMVNTGVAMATVVAVPLGAFLGSAWGWRWVYGGMAIVGLAVLWVQAACLPSIAPAGRHSLRSLLTLARSHPIGAALLATGAISGGHFAAFTYVRPMLDQVADITPAGISGLLLVYGIAGFAGNAIAGFGADRALRPLLLTGSLLLGVAVVSLATLGTSAQLAVPAIAIWGIAFGAMPTLLQTWMARARADSLEAVGGLLVATFQISIAVGAIAGGLVLDTFGVQTTAVLAGSLAVIGGALLGGLKGPR